MDTLQIKSIFEQADQKLEAAISELNRPAEDIVPFMVCRNARNSVSHYLQAFLLAHGTKHDEEVSLETLMSRCRALDNRFHHFDISALKFTNDDEYSADFDEMETCIDLAREAKRLVSE